MICSAYPVHAADCIVTAHTLFDSAEKAEAFAMTILFWFFATAKVKPVSVAEVSAMQVSCFGFKETVLPVVQAGCAFAAITPARMMRRTVKMMVSLLFMCKNLFVCLYLYECCSNRFNQCAGHASG